MFHSVFILPNFLIWKPIRGEKESLVGGHLYIFRAVILIAPDSISVFHHGGREKSCKAQGISSTYPTLYPELNQTISPEPTKQAGFRRKGAQGD